MLLYEKVKAAKVVRKILAFSLQLLVEQESLVISLKTLKHQIKSGMRHTEQGSLLCPSDLFQQLCCNKEALHSHLSCLSVFLHPQPARQIPAPP